VRLTIYSKPGCHLCDEMKSLVRRVVARQAEQRNINVDEIDISTDRELDERYGLEIPVLLINGKKVAKYRISEEELRRMVEARDGGKG
jgi:glutaredoxin